jgi:hypothetical protein
MPKLVRMAQLSRPYQIGLAVIVLLGAVWFVAVRPHNASSSSSSASPAPAVTTVTTTPAASGGSTGQAGAASKVYHGSAPGVEGLTGAVAKAHGAVATSERNAAQLEARSAQASSTTGAPAAPATPASTTAVTVTHSTSAGTAAKATPAKSTTVTATTVTHTTQPIKAHSGAGRVPARQALVERALDEGKPAVILFWNAKGADDVAVHNELVLLEAVHHLIKSAPHSAQLHKVLAASGVELQKKFAAFFANDNQVPDFGSITRGVQIYGTPTTLIVGKSGKTIVITGLTTAYAIEQAIDETRHA